MSTLEEARILLLGRGEIAHRLCSLAAAMGYTVQVMETGAGNLSWPSGVEVVEQIYTDSPFPLPSHTHAVIARGHEGDAESVAALLNHGAERVYLIASARRALTVLEAATPILQDAELLSRLSAPAGLDLGGRSSEEIALAILAEIQQRRHAGSGRPLTELRDERAKKASSVNSDEACPGKRE